MDSRTVTFIPIRLTKVTALPGSGQILLPKSLRTQGTIFREALALSPMRQLLSFLLLVDHLLG